MDTPPNYPERGNPENALYEIWKAAPKEARADIEARLIPLLRRHASRVCWLVLRGNHVDYIEDVVQDAIIDLASFEGRSSFSTWFHARALNRFRNQLRTQSRSREVSLERSPESVQAATPQFEYILLGQAMFEDISLSEEDKEMLRMKFIDGMTDREIAETIGKSFSGVHQRWERVRNRLREKYAH